MLHSKWYGHGENLEDCFVSCASSCMQDVVYNSQAAQFYFFVSCVYCI